MNLQPNINYTINELKAIAGDNYMSLLSAAPLVEIPSPNKPVVYGFDNFNNTTKNIYRSLFNLLSSINPGDTFLLFAVGDRVSGNWRDEEEVQLLNSEYNTIILVSPYEFVTNAKNLPSSIELSKISSNPPIIFNISNNTHRVIIPPTNE